MCCHVEFASPHGSAACAAVGVIRSDRRARGARSQTLSTLAGALQRAHHSIGRQSGISGHGWHSAGKKTDNSRWQSRIQARSLGGRTTVVWSRAQVASYTLGDLSLKTSLSTSLGSARMGPRAASTYADPPISARSCGRAKPEPRTRTGCRGWQLGTARHADAKGNGSVARLPRGRPGGGRRGAARRCGGKAPAHDVGAWSSPEGPRCPGARGALSCGERRTARIQGWRRGKRCPSRWRGRDCSGARPVAVVAARAVARLPFAGMDPNAGRAGTIPAWRPQHAGTAPRQAVGPAWLGLRPGCRG